MLGALDAGQEYTVTEGKGVTGTRATDALDGPACAWLDLAMKTVKIAELKDRLSEHLRAVERGTVSEVIVTDRDRPVARIVPIDQSRRE